MAINLDHVTEQIQVTDPAANASLTVQPKGTGAFNIAAGSSGVNISNGGTVTAITRSSGGSGYTSTPTFAISAPTTAGGTQATATPNYNLFGIGIVSGGTGYNVGNVLTIVGGTYTDQLQISVTTVSGGVITGVSVITGTFGIYTQLPPSNPATVTGGTGTGATFNLTWNLRAINIDTAGSGYVEQPTVTFSGGGGSGAAAYATVGSGTVVRSLGSTLSFYTPSGEGLRINDPGNTTANYIQIQGRNAGASPVVRSAGSSSSIGLIFSSKSSSDISFYTNDLATLQFNVTHTASAVNYVQVTGAATGGQPLISPQGSDTNISLSLTSKGVGNVNFWTNNSGSRQFAVTNTSGTIVNYATATGGATGFGAVFSTAGTDTNIPLVLQPKGTGALQAQQTDSTATGGNARGANAVDWQTTRNAASNVASGLASTISGGAANLATAQYSNVSGGVGNTASGYIAGVGSGYINTAGGYYAYIGGGQSNASNGYYNFIGGGFTNSGTSSSAVTTQSGTMNGTTAVTLSGSNGSIKVGQYITGTSIAGDTYVAAISGTSLTLSKNASGSSTSTLSFYTPHGVVVGGGNNQATGSYSFIGGGGDAGTAANRNVASGDYSTVVGGRSGTASGTGSFVGGGGYFGIQNTYPNTASGTASVVVGGLRNTASGEGAFVGSGDNNIANANYASIAGGNLGTARGIRGNAVFPACQYPIAANLGVSQAALLILAKQTTDATPTVLVSDNTTAAAINQVILPNNSAYYFRGTVVAGVTGGGNSKSWTIEGLIKRGANAASTTLVGVTVMSPFADVGAATWTIAATADTTNGGLAVTFTGQAGTTIRVVAKLETTEMTF